MSKSKQIAKLLKADISMTSDLAEIAKMLESKGRGGDTILAHITKREAEMLKAMGGSGTVNPETGLLEFAPEDGSFVPDYAYGEGSVAQTQPAPVSDQGFKSTATDTFLGTPQQGTPGVNVPFEPSYTTQDVVSGYPQRFNVTEFYRGQGAPSPTPGGPTIPETAAPVTPTVPGVTGGKPIDIGFGPGKTAPDETAQPDFLKKLASGLSTQDMIRLGLAGGLGLVGQQQASKAASQAQQAAGEQQAIAAPYQAQGKELIRAAQAGELTPTGQQSLQAVRAQVAQGVEQRGGVGAAQAAAQVEAFRQQLLQQQYNYGLQVAQVGDSIALGAIKTGLQADQAVQQATNQFYTQLASVAAGLPLAGFAQRTAQGTTP